MCVMIIIITVNAACSRLTLDPVYANQLQTSASPSLNVRCSSPPPSLAPPVIVHLPHSPSTETPPDNLIILTSSAPRTMATNKSSLSIPVTMTPSPLFLLPPSPISSSEPVSPSLSQVRNTVIIDRLK